jgi:lipoate-protein ligase B
MADQSVLNVVNLGRTEYQHAWNVQRAAFELRSTGRMSDLLILNEHNHVYTLGKSSDGNHLLANVDELRSNGVSVYNIDRGGDVTYHGPGQIVGYPILDLKNFYLDLHRYLRDLEEVIIRTVADYGVSGRRDSQFTGVWVGSEKIAAIGIKVSRWITMHGFALNVSTDLSYFDRIIPCGIFHKGVTSLQALLGQAVPIADVRQRVLQNFGDVFGVRIVERAPEELFELSPVS